MAALILPALISAWACSIAAGLDWAFAGGGGPVCPATLATVIGINTQSNNKGIDGLFIVKPRTQGTLHALPDKSISARRCKAMPQGRGGKHEEGQMPATSGRVGAANVLDIILLNWYTLHRNKVIQLCVEIKSFGCAIQTLGDKNNLTKL